VRWQLGVLAAFMALCTWDCGPNGLSFGLGLYDGGKANAPLCDGNACSDVTITRVNAGFTILDKGSKTVIVGVRWAFGLADCGDPSNVTLGAGQTQTYGNGSFCYPYYANYAPVGVPAPPPSPTPSRIASFTITPSSVNAGTSVIFKIVLESPASSAGAIVGFSSITNTGVTNTIVNMPISWQFSPGTKESSLVVNTQRITNETTDIVFTAFTQMNQQSAELKIQ
jgi:hypothetical protein